jgi:hypothetical protein
MVRAGAGEQLLIQIGANLEATFFLRKVMMKLTAACTLASLMLLCTPVLACGTQLNPLPCEPAGLRQTDGQFIFAPHFRPVPSPRARTRSNRRAKG